MRLVIVRHADAGDRDQFAASGRPDSERPLSRKGMDQMRAVAPRLRDLIPHVDHIVTSPFTRARETADILRREYRSGPVRQTESLEPDRPPRALVRHLAQLDGEIVICVGHEPQLSELVGWLTTGEAASFVDFRKAGACLIDFEGAPRRGAGTLRWLFGPKEFGR